MLEGTFNKRLDDLQCSVSRLASQQQIQEKEKSPSQKQPIPSGVHEEGSYSNSNSKLNEVKAIITLRSGKDLTYPVDFVVLDIEPIAAGANYVYHLGKTILGHLQCSHQLQEWCHETHLRKHDFRAQHLPSE